MQLESHATPQVESPQQRYAGLHRAIERGLDSDELWKELADVSLRLGHGDEAVRCLRHIRNETMFKVLQSRLQRLHLVAGPATRPALPDHAEAPAASDAGTTTRVPGGERLGPSLREHVVDAVQYLFHQHMPWLVMVTTLAFPLVVGVGGFLTAGSSMLLLAAIAALPGLCVLTVVGAMGRQILRASSDGSGDVPPVPEFGQLVAAARQFLVDALLVLGSLIAPSLLTMALGAPLTTTLPGLLIGAFFTPLAWALRHVRGDLASLSPVTLLRGVARGGHSYIGLSAVTCLLFVPAALLLWATLGRPVWVQIAAIGPLGVVPLFVASRLLGTWLDSKRADLGNLLSVPNATTPAGETPAPCVASEPAQKEPALPRRPEALQHFHRPVPKHGAPRPAARSATPPTSQKNLKQQPPAKAPPRRPVTGHRAPNQPPHQQPARAIEGRVPKAKVADAPDLASMPGAIVVSGRDRVRQGAASRKQ